MTGMPWFRMYAEAVDDEKLRLLAFEDRWHYVAILCCKCAGLLDAGDAPAMLRRKMAVKLGLASRELDAMAERLEELSLIDAATFQPTAWDGRQFRSDTDPTAAERKRRQRNRVVTRDMPVTSRVTVTNVTRTDTDTDTEKKQKPSVHPSSARFGEWWSVYPKKVGKKPAEQKWRSRGLDSIADTLIADVANRVVNDDGWIRGYIPDPCTYLNQDRWGDDLRKAPIPSMATASKVRTGMNSIQGMKRGLVYERDDRRLDQANVLELGPNACLRLGTDNGGDVD